jgi:hypothetical protein
LILVLAFNACGLPLFFWVKIQVCKIKAEFEEYESDRTAEPVAVFSSDQQGIKRVGSDELLVAGKMYDIVKTQTRNGVTYYYAASDKDEDTYISKLADAEKNAARETSQPAKALKLPEAKYFACNNGHNLVCNTTVICGNRVIVNEPRFFPLDFKAIFSPPPERPFS